MFTCHIYSKCWWGQSSILLNCPLLFWLFPLCFSGNFLFYHLFIFAHFEKEGVLSHRKNSGEYKRDLYPEKNISIRSICFAVASPQKNHHQSCLSPVVAFRVSVPQMHNHLNIFKQLNNWRNTLLVSLLGIFHRGNWSFGEVMREALLLCHKM